MSDFNDDWQLVGTPDPATPQVQPHQVEAQNAGVQAQPVQTPVAQPVYRQPAYQQPVQQTAPQPVYQQPAYQQPVNRPVAQPVYQQPQYRQVPQGYQTVPGFVSPVQVYQPGVDYTAEREKSLTELNRMINHFSPKVDLYQDYEICNADITRYSRTSAASLIWGILIAVSSILLLISSVLEIKYKDNLIVYVSVSIGLFIVGGGLIALYIAKKKYNAKKKAELIARSGELSDELRLLYNGFSNCQLAPEYTDPRILFKLQSLILQGKYFTIFSALNSLLTFRQTYLKINAAKTEFAAETAKRYDGRSSFFNAFRFLNVR